MIMRSTLGLVVGAAVSLLVLGCDDNNGHGGSPNMTSDGAATSSDGAAVSTCAPPPTDPIPAGTCPDVVTACPSLGDDCLETPLRKALENTLHGCGIFCGDFWIGFKDGCATTLRSVLQRDPAQLACLENILFNARFECVPRNGWQRFYAGSCTIP